MPNKLSQFWQELKRRNVVSVITVYAATAFVILELVDIVTEPFGLPDWTMILVVVLLTVGFIISVIISWIYDIHPQGGIVKTEPVHKEKPKDVHVSSSSWKIASYISFAVIVGLIVLNIIPQTKNKKEILDKSIAVLPFRNDSPDEEKMYFINGTMEAIIDNLCKIEDLRVPSRTSIEQYRDNPKPIIVVAKEMNVSYVLEGSGHRDGNNVRLFVQLLDGKKDQHIWSKSYNADIGDIFSLQSEIAQAVAEEIRAIITPEEKQLIEKIPTSSLIAYDLYRQGKEEYFQFLQNNDNQEALMKAEGFYLRALEYDSSFALAYSGLATILHSRYHSSVSGRELYAKNYLQQETLDSVLILTNLALSYDNQLAEAYLVRGDYYGEIGQQDKALKEYEKSIGYNPNLWEAYYKIGIFYSETDEVKSISNLHRAISLHRGRSLSNILAGLARAYASSGFGEKALEYAQEILTLSSDSSSYYVLLAIYKLMHGMYESSVNDLMWVYKKDSSEIAVLQYLGYSYMFLGQHRESYIYYNKYVERLKTFGGININFLQRIGYVYWQNGFKEEADYYFDKQIESSSSLIELRRPHAQALYTYYDLAGVYAFRGEKDKAYSNLRIFNQRETMPLWMVTLINDDPLFDSIRDEPEFQQIVRDVEAKYQAEHDRVRQWLEENDML